jgi:hypothetical protein
MDVLAFPDPAEITEIVNSSSARRAFFNRRAMEFSATVGGMRFRIALVQDGIDTQVRTARFIAASNVADLRSCFAPISNKR